ncbi:F0F1 ATP synthase subunit A [Streptococcus ferus]|uniref:F0F1 ATP synthase subunit A n=1 Tax=Streptococcus ferus TaxID=1345 RepID=UPI00351808D8
MEQTVNPTVNFFGIEFDLTILFMSLLVVLLAFLFVFWTSRHLKMKPTGKQNVLEWVYDFVIGIIKPNLGDYTANYSLFAFCLFLFVLIANNIGLVAKVEVKGYNIWSSPTANFAVDFGLSLMGALICHFEGIRKTGLKNYLKGYLDPTPAMMPMNILEELTNVVSLALRLYGNIYAGEVVLALLVQFANFSVFTAPIAFVLNMLWTGFSIFISGIQAYVFVLLTTTYIGKKVNPEEE